MKKVKTVPETIDVTPKWIHLLPMFFQWLESGAPQQKKFAQDEIRRLATIVDTFMEHRHHPGLSCKCGETFDLS